jgi:hypothetical protein
VQEGEGQKEIITGDEGENIKEERETVNAG